MPVKLNKRKAPKIAKVAKGVTATRVISSLIINKDKIKKMVTKYRTIHTVDPNCLKFIHFNLKEIIVLFIDNQVIDPTISINSQLDDLDNKGLKIYLGNHVDASSCPENPDPTKPNPYLHRDTAIICNTKLDVPNRTWVDQLKEVAPLVNSISVLGAGEGLDRGSICPPNCPKSVDPSGYFHQDILQ